MSALIPVSDVYVHTSADIRGESCEENDESR